MGNVSVSQSASVSAQTMLLECWLRSSLWTREACREENAASLVRLSLDAGTAVNGRPRAASAVTAVNPRASGESAG